MDIIKFKEVYYRNKKLDQKFLEFYGDDSDIVLKNKLELLVELGELANETKCFKYWSKKEPNRELVLEEYADVLLMVFYFFNKLNVSLDEDFPNANKEDINNKFITLFSLISRFKEDYTKELIKKIFINTLELEVLLNFTDDEVVDACHNKIKIDMERFEIDY